jgi:hypothetical protein
MKSFRRLLSLPCGLTVVYVAKSCASITIAADRLHTKEKIYEDRNCESRRGAFCIMSVDGRRREACSREMAICFGDCDSHVKPRGQQYEQKFAIARMRSPARETRAFPGITATDKDRRQR